MFECSHVSLMAIISGLLFAISVESVASFAIIDEMFVYKMDKLNGLPVSSFFY
jgi:hypothetical protein